MKFINKIKTQIDRFTKSFSLREIIWILVLGCMFSFMLKSPVNFLVQKILPYRQVTITVATDTSVTLIKEFSGLNEAFDYCHAAAGTDWDYFEGTLGESWTTLTSNKAGSTISFEAKEMPSLYFAYFTSPSYGSFVVESNGTTETIDCNKGVDEIGIGRYYPFGDSHKKLCLQALIYLILLIVISTLLFKLQWLLKNKNIIQKGWLFRNISLKDFFICWIILYVIAAFTYKVIGIPNYLSAGDEGAYWITGRYFSSYLLENGKIDWDMLAVQPSHRGYWVNVLPFICTLIGSLTGIGSVALYLLFPTATISFMAMYLLPETIKLVADHKTSRYESIVFLVLFLVTWFGYLTACLTDLYSAVLLFAGIVFFSKYFRNKKIIFAILAGLCFGISCSFRWSFRFGVIACIVYIIIEAVRENSSKDGNLIRKIFIGSGLLVLFFMIVSIPQLLINLRNDVVSFFPWSSDHDFCGTSILQWEGTVGLTFGNQLGGVTDSQMSSMITKLYNGYEVKDGGTFLTVTQCLDVFAESPIEALMTIFKKFLIGFNVHSYIVIYPDSVSDWWRQTSGMIYSAFNYYIIFTGIYCLLFFKKLPKKIKGLAALIFIFVLLPFTFGELEARFMMAGHIILYGCFSSYFVRNVIFDKDEYKTICENRYYIPFVVISMFLMFCWSFISWT